MIELLVAFVVGFYLGIAVMCLVGVNKGEQK
jgi:hypothetical protein